jgi:hypothetical protein
MTKTLALLLLSASTIFADVPSMIDPAARYLFYLHGRVVELQGGNARTPDGEYRYDAIVRAFAERGFFVISEVRPPSTEIRDYAKRVAAQVQKLIAARVPPENITVTGMSKGGAITVLTTTLIANSKVNFVVMAGCPSGGGPLAHELKAFAGRPQGRILSMYDEGDKLAGSCAQYFGGARDVVFKELTLHERRGHPLFYTPENVWLDPLTDWALGR